jgi:hypothetical protein
MLVLYLKWPESILCLRAGMRSGRGFSVHDPETSILPDGFGDVLDRGDDDDLVRVNFAGNDKLVAYGYRM